MHDPNPGQIQESELDALRTVARELPAPSVGQIGCKPRNPWNVLVSTIISLRTKDKVTLEASARLLPRASTPEEYLNLEQSVARNLVYPAGFYKKKAENLRKISTILLEKHQGKVPDSTEELLALPGVGLKTANLVLGAGFGIPAICVDIHVHRIANRRGWVQTSQPDDTERELKRCIPKHWWIDLNPVLVAIGQNICTPVSPMCSACPVQEGCKRMGLEKHR